MEPELRTIMMAGAAVAVMCGLLSPLVVLRRLAFVGQGVSHAAFGGVGVAAALGVTSAGGNLLHVLIVSSFCISCALVISWMSASHREHEDTAIGIVLVGAMALGAGLLAHFSDESDHGHADHVHTPEIEEALFGSLTEVSRGDAGLAWMVCGVLVAWLWWIRRPLAFWTLDEPGARVFGVATGRVRTMVLVALALVIVVTMKLSGVVLATALLVLPGAAALKLSERLGGVVALSVALALGGTLGGVALSDALEAPAGTGVVAALIGLWLISIAWGRLLGPARRAA